MFRCVRAYPNTSQTHWRQHICLKIDDSQIHMALALQPKDVEKCFRVIINGKWRGNTFCSFRDSFVEANEPNWVIHCKVKSSQTWTTCFTTCDLWLWKEVKFSAVYEDDECLRFIRFQRFFLTWLHQIRKNNKKKVVKGFWNFLNFS